MKYIKLPPFFFLVEIENSSKQVAPNNLSSPYDLSNLSQEMPQLMVPTKP
jgi:hypothetical protein